MKDYLTQVLELTLKLEQTNALLTQSLLRESRLMDTTDELRELRLLYNLRGEEIKNLKKKLSEG